MRNIILLVLLAAASAEHVQLGFTKNVLQPFKLKQSVSTLERTGKPSFKPTRNPVLEFSPSEAPTGSPTYGSGWLIVNRNQGSCDVTPDNVLAVRTETCIKSYADNEDEFPYYIRASCYTDSAYVQFYYDEECTEQFEEGGIADIELGCETNDDSRFSSIYTFCSSDEDDLPLSDFHSYSVLLGYGAHDDTCADDNIVKMLAWKDSACMSDEEGHSASIVWPDVYTYGSNDMCNGTDFTVTPIRMPDECVATQVLLNETSMTYGDANVTEGAFEGYYAGFQDTSNWQGSVKWVASTARDGNLHFTAKQEVLGILPTDFSDNFDANEAVWANAIASTIGNGITADDVEITRLDLEIYELRRRSLSEGSTDVTYKVSFEADKLDFYTEDEAYETLATALIAGVENGNFTMYLQEWNAELTTEESSGDLGDCSSSKVRVEYDGAPSPEDDDNDGSKWAERASANIISGVIIGIGIVLLAGLAFYAFKQCSAKKE